MDNKIYQRKLMLESIRQEINKMSNDKLEKVRTLVSDLETDKDQEQSEDSHRIILNKNLK